VLREARILFIVVTAGTVCFPSGAQTAKSAHVSTPSTWRLNQSKSDFGSIPPYRSDEINFTTDTPEKMVFSEVVVDAEGTVTRMSWNGVPDGTLQPLIGSDGDKVSFNRDATIWRAVFHDGSSQDGHQSLSDDGKTLIQESTSSFADGSVFHMREVFERVQ